MKTIIVCLLLVLPLLMPLITSAQGAQEDIAIIQNTLGKDKKEIVTGIVKIDSAASGKFWGTYNDYEEDRKKIGRERLSVLTEYATKYETLNNDNVGSIIKADFKAKEHLLALHEKYFKKFSKIIGPLEAGKLMQVESYLKNIVELDIQDQIPFIGEIKN